MDTRDKHDGMDSIAESHKSTVTPFPHYNQPYRGLPAEIRMKIWSYACSKTEVKKGTGVFSRSPFMWGDPTFGSNHGDPQASGKYHLDADGRSADNFTAASNNNTDSFNINIFRLNKQVYSEAMTVTKFQILWIIGTEYDLIDVERLLSSFGPIARNITRGISITPNSLLAGDSDVVVLPSIHANLDMPYVSELHLRSAYGFNPTKGSYQHEPTLICSPPDRWCSPPQSPFAHVHLQQFWCSQVIRSIHDQLVHGELGTLKINYDGVEDRDMQFLSAQENPLFERPRFQHNLTSAEVDALNVTIDWLMGSESLSVSITKKADGS